MTKAKPYAIPKRIVWDAYKKVESESRRGRSGWSIAGGVRERLGEQSLQALESNVLRQLLPASGPSCRDSKG